MAAPLFLAALVVGLLVSVFQAATQINEMTLTFVPKLIAIFITLVVAFDTLGLPAVSNVLQQLLLWLSPRSLGDTRVAGQADLTKLAETVRAASNDRSPVRPAGSRGARP